MLSEDWPSLDVLRLRYIKQVLEHVQNNKTRAADLLGIDRRTLNRILSRTRSQRVRFGSGVTLADLNGTGGVNGTGVNGSGATQSR